MNDPISWDPSLVKKFSSSNHLKMLNQLRNEVIKYPLNNKRKTSSINSTDNNLENKTNSTESLSQNISFSNNSNHSKEDNNKKSTVSFNNARNFSIYNQTNHNNGTPKNIDNFMPEQSLSNEVVLPPTFKERLNQIDLK